MPEITGIVVTIYQSLILLIIGVGRGTGRLKEVEIPLFALNLKESDCADIDHLP